MDVDELSGPIADDDILLPNPPPDLSNAQRVGWYFAGYFSNWLSRADCHRLSCSAKGIARGALKVEEAAVVVKK